MKRILVIGANGQIGSELVTALAQEFGEDQVIAADIIPTNIYQAKHYEVLDILDVKRLTQLVDHYAITDIYHLAALLSVTGEQSPLEAWTLNMNGLLNILELARERVAAGKPLQLFWPSSIAAFGPNTPRINVPQFTVMDPTTMYGISKLAGERLCEYYFTKYAVDVRSLRYPGLIGYQAPPGGGTTDYAIEMFYAAARKEIYKAPLSDTTVLPMMYMPDALRAAIELMRASPQAIRIRSSYNIAAMSFTPMQLAMHIQRHYPEFKVRCCPDHRQDIADSWPDSIDDTQARSDWHWRHHFDLAKMVDDMLGHIKS